MTVSSAVDWWEEWQLRILVLGSLFVQYLLFFSAPYRKLAIPSWFRSIIWLSYLGSDALAIYALATLFSRQRKQNYNTGQGNNIMEVMWAPVLLMHLGGQDGITAYNIEDNELWTRHVLTAVSQITVAIYVFFKSWPGGEKMLLLASILFFFPGILKCIEKPWALKSASFNSLVSLCGPYQRMSRHRPARQRVYIQDLIRFLLQRRASETASNAARHLDMGHQIGRLLPERASEAESNAARHPKMGHWIGRLLPGRASEVASSSTARHPERGHLIGRLLWGRASKAAPRSMTVTRIGNAVPVEDYVQKARALVLDKCYPQATGEEVAVELEHNHVPRVQGEANEVDPDGNYQSQAPGEGAAMDLELNPFPQAQGQADAVDLGANHHRQSHEEDDADSLNPNHAPKSTRWRRLLLNLESSDLGQRRAALLSKERERRRLDTEARKLFLDLASTYPDRLSILKAFLVHNVDEEAYSSLQKVIFETFDLLYTKAKMVVMFGTTFEEDHKIKNFLPMYIRGAAMYLPFAAIGLFHKSHKEVYSVNDIKVTYALFCCTAALEVFSLFRMRLKLRSSGIVAQYSLLSFFVRNKRHTKKMSILSSFNCKDFLDQRWCTDSCSSSSRIIELVLGHVKGWWKEHIVDAASYRKFSDHRGQWTLQLARCDQDLEWSLNRPFDESVLLWHITTDFCFYQTDKTSTNYEYAMGCREISNYMMYLLFINPEMLLSGTRRNLFMIANAELEEILKDDKPLLKKILKGDKSSLMEILKCNKTFLEFLKRKGPSSKEIERGFMQRIIAKFQPTEHREDDPEHTELPREVEQCPSTQEGFVHDAWKISEVLLALGDDWMWYVIEGVWVEMLCFSASRCRGYLHAKSMGSGVELLTYVWFLLSLMGMETLPERLQRMELSSGAGNTGAAP